MNTKRSRTRVKKCNPLPIDLLTIIGARLDDRFDVVRFRAVCKSWQSAIPPFATTTNNNNNSPRFPIKVPNPLSSTRQVFNNTYIRKRTIYRFEPPFQDNNDNSESHKGWLVKAEESEPRGKFRLLNPLSQHQIRYNSETFPKKLNLLDYRVFELCKAYSLQYFTRGYRFWSDKLIFSADGSSVLAIYHGGRLAALRLGDSEWRWFAFSYCTDIMLYNGKFYAVNHLGRVVVIDCLTFETTKVFFRLYACGRTNHFLQSTRKLYVISRNTDGIKSSVDENGEYPSFKYQHSAYFKIYELNEAVWVEVKSLEDRVAFLGKDCSFFASAVQLAGCKGNSIFFNDKKIFYHSTEDDDVLRGLDGHHTCLFNLADCSTRSLSTAPGNFQVIWPPPTWFKKN